MDQPAPPTVIVVHPREKRSKCSVEPLRSRSGFVFWTFPKHGDESLNGYVRLGFEGPLLTKADRERGLLILDATWRLAGGMEADFQDIPSRSLLPWRTAYPRVSKLQQDPAAGLATIEALFAAFMQMGRPVDGLLDHYYWADRFLSLNGELIDTLTSHTR